MFTTLRNKIMAKLSLEVSPTFPLTVTIPKAGAEPVMLKLTGRHRTKTQLDEFIKSRADKEDAASILDMATGWDLDDAFTLENIEMMCQNYIAAPLEIYRAYIDQLVGAKAKN